MTGPLGAPGAVRVEFVVLTDGESDPPVWTPIGRLAPADLLARWNTPHISCCTLQAGFRVAVDGRVWNGDAIDEIGMADTWLHGVQALLDGATRVGIWAWEESRMTLSRHGEVVHALDVHHGGTVVCPLVRLPLRALARGLADAADAAMDGFDALSAAAGPAHATLLQVLGRQHPGDWRARAAALRAAAARPIPAPPAGDRGPLPPVWEAALLHDLDGLAAGDPDTRVDDQPLLHLAIDHVWEAGLRALLAAGADLRARYRGFTPLQEAARRAVGRPEARVLADALVAAGAPIDPVSAVLLGDPDAFERCVARRELHRETLSWWVVAATAGVVAPDARWRALLRAAVARGLPVTGRRHGLGGWTETPREQAARAGRADLVAFIDSL